MRDEILAYKRERILEEAVKLFYERGFTGTTLDDIAAELGVTKPFIYTHFRGKVELLAALCKPTIELSLEAVANAYDIDLDAPYRTLSAKQQKVVASFGDIVLAATTLSTRRTGALIVIERLHGLRNYIENGIALDAVVSYDLLINLFQPDTPLHDGAVIIQDDRIAAD